MSEKITDADISNSTAADISLNTDDIQKRCANCNILENKLENKFKTCSKCMNVWYCSVKCQTANWKKHRPECKTYCDWVTSLEENIQTYRIKAPIERSNKNKTTFNNHIETESMAILANPEKMLSLFNPEHIRAVISDKSIEGHGRVKELLNILSFNAKGLKQLKYPPLKLIDELIKAAQMEDNATITRIRDIEGITTKGILNGYVERVFLNKFNESVATYKGNFINGSPSHGEFTNNMDNSIYVGDFKDDKKNGQGTLTYLDGSYTYTGGFKDDKKHGQGTIIYPNTRTIGTWNNDKLDGEIKFIENDTSRVFVSFYVDGVEDENKRQIIEPNGGKTRRKKTNRKSRKIKRLTTNKNKQFRRI